MTGVGRGRLVTHITALLNSDIMSSTFVSNQMARGHQNIITATDLKTAFHVGSPHEEYQRHFCPVECLQWWIPRISTVKLLKGKQMRDK